MPVALSEVMFEKLRRELDDTKAQLAWRKRREDILRTQFAFYVQHGQKVDPGEFPKLGIPLAGSLDKLTPVDATKLGPAYAHVLTPTG